MVRPSPAGAAEPWRCVVSGVRVEQAGAVVRIVLAEPERLNAVDAAMLDAITAAVEQADQDPQARLIVLAAEGRGFCSGAHLDPGGDGEITDTLYAAGRTISALLGSRLPVLALVHGVAAGVGVSLALVADYVLVSDKASFVLAFANIGLMPDGGATALVAANIGRARAMRLALTGEKLDAATAMAWGLVSELAESGEFEERAAAVSDKLAASAPLGVAATKAAINTASLDLASALGREETGQAALLGTADFAEGVGAFLEKRRAVFTGA